MSRNKLAMILLALMLLPMRALGDDIIDVDELTLETANYDLYTIEYGEYSKPATATGYMVYMVEQEMFMEEGTARLKKLHVMRNAEVKAGDVLATYEKEGSRRSSAHRKALSWASRSARKVCARSRNSWARLPMQPT